MGALCKNHEDPGRPDMVCQKSVTVGDSGLSYDEPRIRVKRWLVAGLDDDGWPDEKRAEHVGMGRKFLQDFAVGLREVELDRIANGE